MFEYDKKTLEYIHMLHILFIFNPVRGTYLTYPLVDPRMDVGVYI